MNENTNFELMEDDVIKVKNEGLLVDVINVKPQLPTKRSIICREEAINKSEIKIEDTKLSYSIGAIQCLVVDMAYECYCCKSSSRSLIDLRKHLGKHAVRTNFECAVCSKKCSTKLELRK